ncbi:46215_t:CDS:2 [Gigaspora margarita]|uniref:46215_t:CDS:1 n=1 Tax=Gigaspora margarita TaxID=4874 RepID=A0ABM8W590_GIGMA|nr:46215_t:CDS:2 [Gigaspora margarita]
MVCTASAAKIIWWKKSSQVDDCYRALFEQRYINEASNESIPKIINSKLAERLAAERARQSSPEPKPEPEPVPIYQRNLSMMSIEELDKLFGIN